MPDTTTLVLLVVAGLVVAGVGAVFWTVRRNSQREATAAYHHFRCPGCRRRLRYQRRQVGHKGGCSHCGKEVTFPPVSKSVD